MFELGAIIGVALVGALHCAVMCGGFAAIAAGAQRTGRRFWLRYTAYGVGKAAGYASIGLAVTTLLHGAGRVVFGSRADPLVDLPATPAAGSQAWLAVVIGAALVLAGLAHLVSMAGGPRSSGAPRPVKQLGVWWAATAAKARTAGPFALGYVNGFLPCGLMLAALAVSASSGSPVKAMALMAVFGAATMPALLAAAWVIGRITPEGRRVRHRWIRPLQAVLLVVLGILTLLRAVPGDDPHVHSSAVAVGCSSTIAASEDADHGQKTQTRRQADPECAR